MASEIAKAYVQIMPSARGIKGKLEETFGGEADFAGKSFGNKMIGGIKKVLASAAIGKAISSAVTEGAALEQSIGGIETLFKDSAEKVKQNAANAYRTAGMSANEYMELTTSFSASLLSSLSNDTSKAADIAEMAMTDMSDNANKMGTNMEDIKNAYQGFAKQNYTMLDNLKLGYGGTKTEMERLLADAQKITGVKYDINNLSDVYSAIHVIQGELDITGTTAKEAATTVSGSAAQMKAAFKNVLGNIALGESVENSLYQLQESVFTFAKNLIPMIGNVLSAVPQLVEQAITMIVLSFNVASNNSGKLIEQGMELVSNLVAGIITNTPYLVEAAWNLITSFGAAIMNADWETMAGNLITMIRGGLDTAAGEILGTDGNIVESVLESITNSPGMLTAGVEMVTSLANGISESIPGLIMTAGTLAIEFVNDGILPMFPTVLSAGTELVLNLASGIITNIPVIVSSAAVTIANFLASVGKNLPQILQAGIEIIGKLAAGLIQAIPTLIGKIPQIITSIRNAFTNVDWGTIGINIITGIANGLRNAAGMLWDAVKDALGNFKEKILGFFGIHSPSKWGEFVGKMIPLGVANGFLENLNLVEDAADKMNNMIANPFKTDVTYTANGTESYSRAELSSDLLNKLDKLLVLLEIMIRNDKEIKFYFKDREVARILRDMGVVFE